MRVIVADALFDGTVPHPVLFRLLGFAYEGRHRVLIDRGPAFQRWHAALSDDARERYDAALDTSAELEAREPAEHEIRIGAAADDATVDEAIEQLERPFLLLIENEESDRSFIEAIAAPHYRAHLARMFRRGWLVFRSRGGISGIKPMIEQTLRDFPDDAWRMFAVFDSDAPAPRKPHREARQAAEACTRARVTFRMLARRAIENYLTHPALTAWANLQATGVGELQSKIEVLYGDWFGEQPERRHHFEMKKGFDRMRPYDSIYEDPPSSVQQKLRNGFGSDVTRAFRTGELREVDLRDEGAWDELSEMIESLVRRMR